MRKRYLRRIGGLILAVLLLPGIVLVSSSSAVAQGRRGRVVVIRPYRPYRPWYYRDPFRRFDRFDRYNQYSHYVFSSSEKAFNQGYKDGLKTGKGDLKNRRTYDPERSHYFQEAGFGNFGEVYRNGFLRGYADGFRA